MAQRDPRKREDFILVEDHAIDSGARYLLAVRPIKVELPDVVDRRREEREIIQRLKEAGSQVTGGLLGITARPNGKRQSFY